MSKILIVGLNFHPEPTGIGKFTGEMAAYLGGAGHQVRAVTSPPYYPYWRVQDGYRSWAYRRENWHGVQVFRCPLWVPRQPSGPKRLLHHLSFALSSVPILLMQIFWRPDVVLCVAPSFFSAPLAWIVARLSGARAWLHLQDFELEAATRLGILRGEPLAVRLAARAEIWLLQRFDRVSTISQSMLRRLEAKKIKPERLVLFPNWVDTESIHPLTDSRESLRKLFDLPPEKITVLYSGSMGRKQGLEILTEAARELVSRQDILFVFCGQGSARAELELLTSGMPNVRFLRLQPIETLNQLLNAADIHILPQRAGAADLVMPSKLLGMLASGKPVIATADLGTEVGRVVREVGIAIPPDDLALLSRAILELAASPQTRARLGKEGRAYVTAHWGTEQVLGRFLIDLQELVNQSNH
ncbi:MAG TPA: glycosyltransferase WbuB [Anaerolineales bacterium]